MIKAFSSKPLVLAKVLGLSLFLGCSLYAKSATFNNLKKPLYGSIANKLSGEYSLFFGALKYYNFGAQFHFNYQVLKPLSIQAGTGFNYFQYDIYSTSDLHRLSILWLPLNVGTRLDLISIKEKKYTASAYGKLGIAIALTDENNKIKSKPFNEFGIGITRKGKFEGDKMLLDFGFQQYKLKGQLTSSFQSTIDYNLNFQSFLCRITVVRLID